MGLTWSQLFWQIHPFVALCIQYTCMPCSTGKVCIFACYGFVPSPLSYTTSSPLHLILHVYFMPLCLVIARGPLAMHADTVNAVPSCYSKTLLFDPPPPSIPFPPRGLGSRLDTAFLPSAVHATCVHLPSLELLSLLLTIMVPHAIELHHH